MKNKPYINIGIILLRQTIIPFHLSTDEDTDSNIDTNITATDNSLSNEVAHVGIGESNLLTIDPNFSYNPISSPTKLFKLQWLSNYGEAIAIVEAESEEQAESLFPDGVLWNGFKCEELTLTGVPRIIYIQEDIITY